MNPSIHKPQQENLNSLDKLFRLLLSLTAMSSTSASSILHFYLAAATVLSSTLVAASPSAAAAAALVPGALSNDGLLAPRMVANEHDAIPLSNKRRHHAKMADLAKRNISPRALLSLTGFGTLYYDINGGGTCGPANGWSSFPETNGFTMCEPWTGPKTIAQRGSNRIVALPVSMMAANLKNYCGKEVIAHYNGKTVGGLIAWDGCAACEGAVSLAFILFSSRLVAWPLCLPACLPDYLSLLFWYADL